jgi:translocator assembly and maintenance protein 41
MSTPEIDQAQRTNLRAALSTALLQLPRQFTELQLWEQIAGISYSGDPRMSVPGAENPEKVKNIVRGPGNLAGFRDLYRPILEEMGGLQWVNGGAITHWEGAGEGMVVVRHRLAVVLRS